ncbi:MAG TPA: hypothetical protein VGU25_18185 [Acidobacteriaceae bacterium]|nr:hypothetical protein [Acidobacteriaceae bacterium]
MGRDGYLQYQSHYYDKHVASFANPAAHAVGYAVFIAIWIGLYELTAFIAQRLLAGRFRSSDTSQP